MSKRSVLIIEHGSNVLCLFGKLILVLFGKSRDLNLLIHGDLQTFVLSLRLPFFRTAKSYFKLESIENRRGIVMIVLCLIPSFRRHYGGNRRIFFLRKMSGYRDTQDSQYNIEYDTDSATKHASLISHYI